MIAATEPRRQIRASTCVLLFVLFAAVLFAIHSPLLTLPYFWDEHGQFVPAALDILRDGAWVPRSTVPNVHPPGVMAYLAVVWRVFGYSIIATRTAMLALASLGMLFTFLLALELCGGLGARPGGDRDAAAGGRSALLHAGHDGATGHACDGVHGRRAPVLPEGAVPPCGRRLRRAGADQGDRRDPADIVRCGSRPSEAAAEGRVISCRHLSRWASGSFISVMSQATFSAIRVSRTTTSGTRFIPCAPRSRCFAVCTSCSSAIFDGLAHWQFCTLYGVECSEREPGSWWRYSRALTCCW